MNCMFKKRMLPVVMQSGGGINEELIINTAALRAASIVSGGRATLSVKATEQAATLIVTDSSGSTVELTNVASSTKNGIVTFTATWTVTGSRGDILDYTVAVYDANGLRSANLMTVTVTIK